jgi:hypothetical protein
MNMVDSSECQKLVILSGFSKYLKVRISTVLDSFFSQDTCSDPIQSNGKANLLASEESETTKKRY